MCPIRRNSLLVHAAYPQILGTNGLVVVVLNPDFNATLGGTVWIIAPPLEFRLNSSYGVTMIVLLLVIISKAP